MCMERKTMLPKRNAAKRSADKMTAVAPKKKRIRRTIDSVGKKPPKDMRALKSDTVYILTRLTRWGMRPAMFLQSETDPNDVAFYKPPAQYRTWPFKVGDRVTLLSVGYSSTRNLIAKTIQIESGSLPSTEKEATAEVPSANGATAKDATTEVAVKVVADNSTSISASTSTSKRPVDPKPVETNPNPKVPVKSAPNGLRAAKVSASSLSTLAAPSPKNGPTLPAPAPSAPSAPLKPLHAASLLNPSVAAPIKPLLPLLLNLSEKQKNNELVGEDSVSKEINTLLFQPQNLLRYAPNADLSLLSCVASILTSTP